MMARYVSTTAGGQSVFTTDTTSNNGLLSTGAAFGAGATWIGEIDGIIVTTSTGTLSIQAAEGTSGDSFTVSALSFFHLEPIT
jgi:hypothetical protein